MHSGIATQGKTMVLSTVEKYDWVQIAGSMKHPEKGKIIDISAEVTKETGVADASVVLYPVDGYGNQEIVRELIVRERPDAILHFTDPRFWGWLYAMEHEIRQEMPLMYLNIWDDLPDPKWNEPFYRSCDMLMAISKQTYGINKRICNDYEDWQIQYVPHGINSKVNNPIQKDTDEYKEMLEYRKTLTHNKDIDFIVFANNRNIRRKNLSDIILAYKNFCDTLTPEKANKCMLYIHTTAVDNAGTDLLSVIENVCPKYHVHISSTHASEKELKYMYNLADVTVNLASNEGFGLTTCESLMNGTPIIVNVTGGLQDQCGFKLNGKHITADDYVEIGSLHDKFKWLPKLGKELTHGPWAYPVWSRTRSLKGSVPTPYIFDDTVAYEDVIPALEYFYNLTREERKMIGKQGHEWVMSDESGMNINSLRDNYLNAIGNCFLNWEPRKRFGLYETEKQIEKVNALIINPRIKEQPKETELKLPKLKKVTS
jgi:glycosyltransferase involved in cell wall biosynthesis